jgi:hypothetical protein
MPISAHCPLTACGTACPAGLLRNAPRTSPTAAGQRTMSGQAGVTAPVITHATLDDPDNGDTVLSPVPSLGPHLT